MLFDSILPDRAQLLSWRIQVSFFMCHIPITVVIPLLYINDFLLHICCSYVMYIKMSLNARAGATR